MVFSFVMEGMEYGTVFGVFGVVVRGGIIGDGLGRSLVLELTK